MIRTDKLRGIIAEKGYSQADVAGMIGITPKTFYEKMKIRKTGGKNGAKLVLFSGGCKYGVRLL